jgi:hypothetical protein
MNHNGTHKYSLIITPYFAKLTEEKKLYFALQQHSAMTHTAYASLEALCKVIIRGLWHPRSPDLISRAFDLR